MTLYCFHVLSKGQNLMSGNHLNFKVDYSRLKIYDEYNTDNLQYPLVLSVPHKGQIFPDEFLCATTISQSELRCNEDSFVDELLQGAIQNGVCMLAMNIARSFIDVNRDKMEIDPTMFYNYPSPELSMGRRCRLGLGVIHRITAKNHPIYNGLLDYEEVQERFTHVYDVYHKRLQQLIDKCLKKFGLCFVLDCHSMPSEICSLLQETQKIDFCLGTLFGQSCPEEFHAFFKSGLDRKNYYVSDNCPYSGAYITFNYCQPRQKIYTMQMEVNRGLYMNEQSYKKNGCFSNLCNDISQNIIDISHFLLDFKK